MPQTPKKKSPPALSSKSAREAQKMGQIHNTVGKAAPGSTLATKPLNALAITFADAVKAAKAHIGEGLQALTAAIAMKDVSDRDLAELHTYVKSTEDAVSEAGKFARARVLDATLAKGTPTGDSGLSRVMDLGGGLEQRVTIQKSGTDPTKFEGGIRAKNGAVSKYMDTVIKFKLKEGTASEDLAVADGLFTPDEIKAMAYEPTYRVDRVKEAKKS